MGSFKALRPFLPRLRTYLERHPELRVQAADEKLVALLSCKSADWEGQRPCEHLAEYCRNNEVRSKRDACTVTAGSGASKPIRGACQPVSEGILHKEIVCRGVWGQARAPFIPTIPSECIHIHIVDYMYSTWSPTVCQTPHPVPLYLPPALFSLQLPPSPPPPPSPSPPAAATALLQPDCEEERQQELHHRVLHPAALGRAGELAGRWINKKSERGPTKHVEL